MTEPALSTGDGNSVGCAIGVDQRWEHADKRRYYELQLTRDLFGTMLVQCRWGRIGSRLGGGHQLLVTTKTLPDTLGALVRRRQQRGYVCVRGPG